MCESSELQANYKLTTGLNQAAFNQRFQLDAMMDWPLVFFNEAVSCAALNKTAIYLGGVTLQRSIRVEICKQNIKLPSFKHGTTLTVVVVKVRPLTRCIAEEVRTQPTVLINLNSW